MAHKALRLYLQNWPFFILFLYVLVVFEFFWGKPYKKCAQRLDSGELLVGALTKISEGWVAKAY
jgi:hypothetical protein